MYVCVCVQFVLYVCSSLFLSFVMFSYLFRCSLWSLSVRLLLFIYLFSSFVCSVCRYCVRSLRISLFLYVAMYLYFLFLYVFIVCQFVLSVGPYVLFSFVIALCTNSVMQLFRYSVLSLFSYVLLQLRISLFSYVVSAVVYFCSSLLFYLCIASFNEFARYVCLALVMQFVRALCFCLVRSLFVSFVMCSSFGLSLFRQVLRSFVMCYLVRCFFMFAQVQLLYLSMCFVRQLCRYLVRFLYLVRQSVCDVFISLCVAFVSYVGCSCFCMLLRYLFRYLYICVSLFVLYVCVVSLLVLCSPFVLISLVLQFVSMNGFFIYLYTSCVMCVMSFCRYLVRS